MIFSEAYEGSIYTGEKLQLLYPNNTQYTGHLGLLNKMIVGITESRLAQVAYDFNVQITKADQTIEKLVANMIIGETALPIEKQVIHVSSVRQPTEVQAADTSVISSYDTKDCNLQKQGLTIVDPSNSKNQVLKASG